MGINCVTYRRLKVVAAILLPISLALPISSCTRYENQEGKQVRITKGEPLPDGVKKVVSYDYVLEDFEPELIKSWLILLSFVWPIIVVGVLFWLKRGRIVVLLRILEPFLIMGSFDIIHFISSFLVGRREVGAYVAFLALGVYAVGSIWEDIATCRNWRRGRRT